MFLAGVSGRRAMILDLAVEGCAEPIMLVHRLRPRTDLQGRAEFEAQATAHTNFRYVAALSHGPVGSDWMGEHGFVHETAKRLYRAMFAGDTACLCGLPPMIGTSIAALMQGRLCETHILTERFLTAGDGVEKPESPVLKRP